MFAGNVCAMVILVYWSIRMEKLGNSNEHQKQSYSTDIKG